ncbi:peptide deformylase [Candidatus Berkelbacteria bacterium]|nr:peptide deformylase [Candidatus Berkelbacteria bacterium]
MTALPIVLYPNPVLTAPTRKVTLTNELRNLITQMVESMHRAEGVGLAATQIGQSLRLCVLEHEPDSPDDPLEAVPLQVLVNAKIISHTGGQDTVKEGCLSLPGIEVPVTRARKIKVKAFDQDGRAVQFRAAGFHARIIQHELDHLDGRLIIDHAKNPHKTIEEYLSTRSTKSKK